MSEPSIMDCPCLSCPVGKANARIAEAARAFAAVTLNLESTPEGAALLAALKELEAMND